MMKFSYTLLLALFLVASNAVFADTQVDAAMFSMADIEAAIMADNKLEPAPKAQVEAAFVADVATMARLEAEAATEDVSD